MIVLAQAIQAGHNSIITPETLIPIGGTISIVGTIVWGVWTLRGIVNRLDNRLSYVEQASKRQWGVQNMEIWALKLKVANSTLSVPDVEKPVDYEEHAT